MEPTKEPIAEWLKRIQAVTLSSNVKFFAELTPEHEINVYQITDRKGEPYTWDDMAWLCVKLELGVLPRELCPIN